jgi:hypothetical protein
VPEQTNPSLTHLRDGGVFDLIQILVGYGDFVRLVCKVGIEAR